jgi:hypothetical protein
MAAQTPDLFHFLTQRGNASQTKLKEIGVWNVNLLELMGSQVQNRIKMSAYHFLFEYKNSSLPQTPPRACG